MKHAHILPYEEDQNMAFSGLRWLLLLALAQGYPVDGAINSDNKDRPYFERRGEVVWEVPTDQKVIALTFDDGPNPVYTPQILDLLDQYHAKATFFVVGSRVKKYPQVAKELVLRGHEIANHTYRHPNLGKISFQQFQAEMEQTKMAILEATGITSHLFRPPGGYYDERIVNAARQAGYLVVMWSWHQDTRDWANPGTHLVVRKVLSNARNGDIVLFHDNGGDRSQTIDALEKILPELKQRGYRFITVSELVNIRSKKPVHKGEAP
jgi:polysaccharide deacetylase family sporulation protein PdaB